MESPSKKRKSIVLESSVFAVMDGIVSTVDNSLNQGVPLLAIAWGLSKGMYGASIQLRQARAVEFVEMIRDNPGIFTKELLKTEEFQDGFVYAFQKYLSERVAQKRKTIKEVFCGFSKDEDKESFRLERLLLTIEQISLEDIEVVKTFYDGTIRQWVVNQFPDMDDTKVKEMTEQPLNIGQIGNLILNQMKGLNQFADDKYTLETLSRLSSLGLLIAGIQSGYNVSSSTFQESSYGREFITYILNQEKTTLEN